MPIVNPAGSPAIPNVTTFASVSLFSDVRALGAGQYPAVEVLGGTVVGDGYDGIFYWSSTSVAADDAATVLAPNAGGTGRWIRIYGGLSLSTGSSRVGTIQSGSGAVADTLQGRGRWQIRATDYMSAAMRADVGTGSVDCASAINAAMTYAATLVPAPATYTFGSVWVVLPAGLIGCSGVSVPTGVELVCVEGIAVLKAIAAGSTGFVVDTTLYASGNTPHYNGGVRNVHMYGLGAGTSLIGLRQRNTQNFVVENVRFENFADQAWQQITNASGGSAACITTFAKDVRAHNCLLNTTRGARSGMFEVSGTDHELYSCEAYNPSSRTLSGSKRCVGWMLTGVTASSFVRCRGDEVDQGWYLDANTADNQFANCMSVNTLAEGWDVLGFKNTWTNLRVDSPSLDTTNTYDGFVFEAGSANNVIASGILDNISTPGKNARYGLTDANTTAGSPNVISPLVKISIGATGNVNYSGATTLYVGPTRLVKRSHATVSVPADTSEDTLATVTVPANLMGSNGVIKVTTWWTLTNNANSKVARVRFSGASGTQYLNNELASQGGATGYCEIMNYNATNSQYGGGYTIGGGAGTVVQNIGVTSAVDTTADTTVVITGQKGSGGDTMSLKAYRIEVVTDMA